MVATFLLALGLLPAGADPARAAVICAEVSFSLAAERRDLTTFRHLLDDEARFVSDEVLRGPQAIADAWAGFFEPDGPEIRWRPAIVEVVQEGSLAISRGPYRIRGRGADGEIRESWGTFNSVWRRKPNGEWRILFDAGSNPGQTPGDDDRRVLDQEPECPPSGSS